MLKNEQMKEEDLFFKHAVIPPLKQFSIKDNNEANKYHRIVVDSAFRDIKLFPTPSKYDFTLDSEISDVVSISLLNADIPLSMYLINTNFNTFSLNNQDITIANGDYDISTLINAIQSILPGGFVVGYNIAQSTIYISNTNTFTFNPNKLDKLLGFLPKNYTSIYNSTLSKYIITAPYKYNLNYNNCIIMYITGCDPLRSSITQYDRAFAIITKENNKLNINNIEEYIKYFSPPIGRLLKFTIKFLDRYGNTYDFNNIDHRFELMITNFKLSRKYANVTSMG